MNWKIFIESLEDLVMGIYWFILIFGLIFAFLVAWYLIKNI